MLEINNSQGILAVKLARKTLEIFLNENRYLNSDEIKEINTEIFNEKLGVFVTLLSFPRDELRGCIGYPLPVKILREAIMDNAINAATQDFRFKSITKDELDKIRIEVSILTPPQEIKIEKTEDLKKIEIGVDGLIIKYGFSSGLLLPQVAVEWGFNQIQFLEALCQKAGLPKDMWQSKNCKISKFSAKIFSEEVPRGEIKKRFLIK